MALQTQLVESNRTSNICVCPASGIMNADQKKEFNLIQTGGGESFRTPLRQNRDNSYTERAMTFKFPDFS